MPNPLHHTNRLINQKSPYLLQHAHNPVDWYPWGEEAFEAAKEADKPIFLSIGYSTCHWCHVMERESFENEEIAKEMNAAFINIKLDREEHPYLDNLYMDFAQSLMAGVSGWPLNVILTPGLKPFFAATYLPPHTKSGLMGLSELIKRIVEVWNGEEREHILLQADKILEIFAESVHLVGANLPDKESIQNTIELLFKISDPIHGGIKGIPKFPIGYQYNLFLHYYATMKDSRALFIAERTLDFMQRGGIYDHLGGGFSRYSVDEFWLVPHFEKMLYDNALLIISYLELWQITKKALYKEICSDIITYILRDMTSPEGGFYSAEDADSEGEEGKFYTWKLEEIENILGKEQSNLIRDYYQVTPAGNFEGRNILHIPERVEAFSKKHNLDLEAVSDRITAHNTLLWKVRETRIHPEKDEKILSSWNGLMIHALVEAGCAFNKPEYLEAAMKAAHFIRSQMWKDGVLFRRWCHGEVMYRGGLDDYAFLIKALLSLFEADMGTEWLKWALQMADILAKKFKSEKGAFYQTDESDEYVILRKAHFADGAEPSGSSIHCENLLRLYQLTSDPSFLDQAEDILKAVKNYIDNYAPGYTYSIINLIRYYNLHAPTLVISLNKQNENYESIKKAIYENFIPHKAVIWRREEDQELFHLIPSVKERIVVENQTTLYLCYKGICQKPLNSIDDITKAIEKL
jgi:uncharacterized protein YyaL (SSP411 family)